MYAIFLGAFFFNILYCILKCTWFFWTCLWMLVCWISSGISNLEQWQSPARWAGIAHCDCPWTPVPDRNCGTGNTWWHPTQWPRLNSGAGMICQGAGMIYQSLKVQTFISFNKSVKYDLWNWNNYAPPSDFRIVSFLFLLFNSWITLHHSFQSPKSDINSSHLDNVGIKNLPLNQFLWM